MEARRFVETPKTLQNTRKTPERRLKKQREYGCKDAGADSIKHISMRERARVRERERVCERDSACIHV